MRQSLLRRIVAAVFLVVGIGAVSSALPAQASAAPAVHHVVSSDGDWQWTG